MGASIWTPGSNLTIATEVINITEYPYLAIGNGTTDNLAAIQAAINALPEGGQIFIPEGIFNISAALSVPYNSIKFTGIGINSVIRTTSTTADIFLVGNGTTEISGLVFEDFNVTSSVVKTAGHGFNCRFITDSAWRNIRLDSIDNYTVNGNVARLFDGIYFDRFSQCLYTGGEIVTSNTGVKLRGNLDNSFGAEVWFEGGLRIFKPITGILVGGACGGVRVGDIDISVCGTGVLINQSLQNTYNREVFFAGECSIDSCTGSGVVINQPTQAIARFLFNHTWIAGCTLHGIDIQNANDARVIANIHAYSNDGDGIRISDLTTYVVCSGEYDINTGYGVNSTVVTSNVFVTPTAYFLANGIGTINTTSIQTPYTLNNAAFIGIKSTALGAVYLNLESYIEDDGAYNVMGFVNYADKAAIRTGTSVVDVTTKVQAALTAAFGDNRRGLYVPRGLYNVSAEILLEMSGTRISQGLRIRGAGMNSAIFKKVGSQTSMIRFAGSVASPGTGPFDSQLVISDLSIYGVGKTADGITLQDLAGWTLRNVQTDACKDNLVLKSALIGQVDGCILNAGKRGVVTRQSASGGSGINTVTLTGNTQIKYNTDYGLDIGYAMQFIATPGVQVERNGTQPATVTITNASPAVVSFTAHGLSADIPVIFTTTGTLPTGLTAGTTYFIMSAGLAAGTFQVSATVGGAAINTSTAGSGVHTCTPQTDGVIIRNTCDDAIGIASVHLDGLWMESNYGGYTIRQEAMGEFLLSISRTNILTPQGGKAIKTLGGRWVSIDRVHSPSAGDTTELVCDFGSLTDSLLATLIDTSVKYPKYENSKTSTVDYVSGKTESVTLTLSGCTTSPTGTLLIVQNGRNIRLTFPNITGTSNTTAANLGVAVLPARYRPAATVSRLGICQDNGVEKASAISIGADGTITLNNGFTAVFTASGTKGVSACAIEYEIA